MKHKNALATVAMHYALYEAKRGDYGAFYDSYILRLLPTQEDAEVDVKKLKDKLQEQFALMVPLDLLKNRLLPALCQAGYLVGSKNGFKVGGLTEFDKEQFDRRVKTFKEGQENVTLKLSAYLSAAFSKNYSQSIAQECLLLFFDKYGYCVATRQIKELRNVSEVREKEINLIRRFIIEEYEAHSSVFDCIAQYAQGFSVYKAVYFFQNHTSGESNPKFDGVSFYLDTSLLIQLLGLNSDEEKSSVKELCSLIQASGGYVKTFSHYVDELEGILKAYAASKPEDRSTFTLKFFLDHDWPNEFVLDYAAMLPIRLELCEVVVEDIAAFGTRSDSDDYKNRGFIGEAEFSEFVKNIYSPSRKKRMENDVATVTTIARLRGITGHSALKDCRFVFVSNNVPLAEKSGIFYSRNYPKAKMPLVLTGLEMTAMLWLNSAEYKSDIPKTKLIADAYAANYPSVSIVDAFRTKAEALADNGVIHEVLWKDFFASKNFNRILAERYPGDVTLVTDDSVEDILRHHLYEVFPKEAAERKELDKRLVFSAYEIEGVTREVDRVTRLLSESETKRSHAESDFLRIRNMDLENIDNKAKEAEKLCLALWRVISGLVLAGGCLILAIVSIRGFMELSLCQEFTKLSMRLVGETVGALLLLAGAIHTFSSDCIWFIKRIARRMSTNVYLAVYNKEKERFDEKYTKK